LGPCHWGQSSAFTNEGAITKPKVIAFTAKANLVAHDFLCLPKGCFRVPERLFRIPNGIGETMMCKLPNERMD